MHLGTIDYAIVAAYFALIIGMGLYFGRKAKRSMLDYFLSHRSLP
jgi:Na+/proline symporter